MGKKNKGKKNKNKNIAEASSANPIPDSPPPQLLPQAHPPPPVPPERTTADQRLYDQMKDVAIAIATTALEKYDLDKRVAEEIKNEFDSRYGPTWHCIVGNFVSCVSYEPEFYFYFSISTNDIILFKCG